MREAVMGETRRGTRILTVSIAVALLVAVALGILTYPFARIPLALGLIAYLFVVHQRPNSWPLVLLVLLPLLDLSPWAGERLFHAFDFFILATIGYLLLRGLPELPTAQRPAHPERLLLLLLFLSNLSALAWGLLPLMPWNADASSVYYSHYNAIRLGKGFFEAFCLLPVLRRQLHADAEGTVRYLLLGASLSLIGFGLVILWERGVFHDLAHAHSIYGAVSGLLDFSTRYRITGLFSAMHSGGSTVDGYLLLSWPFTLATAFYYRHHPLAQTIGVVAFLFAAYAVAVTFTRTTYAAFAIALVIFLVGLATRTGRPISRLRLAAWFAFAIAAFLAFVYSFSVGGTLALLVCELAVLVGASAGAFQRVRQKPYIIIALIAGSPVLFYLVLHAATTSRWADTPYSNAVLIAAIVPTSLLAAATALGYDASRLASRRTLIATLIALLGVAGLIVPSTGGYRMESRFSRVSSDLNTRLMHWKNVLTAFPDTTRALLFGAGTGRYPERYLLAHPRRSEKVGTYTFQQRDGNTFLRLGGGSDQQLGQRVSLRPHTPYVVSMDARTASRKLFVTIQVCYRNILYEYAYNSSCHKIKLYPRPDGQWHRLTKVFDSGKLGLTPWFEHWPTTITVSNYHPQTIVDVDNISLIAPNGRNLLSNGNFAQGGDRWYSYNDFEHLPWHIKNLWLHVFFEQGLVGVLLFTIFTGYVVVQIYRHRRRANAFSVALFSSLCGFLLLGVTGSPVDTPRIAWYFYILLLLSTAYTSLAAGADEAPAGRQ